MHGTKHCHFQLWLAHHNVSLSISLFDLVILFFFNSEANLTFEDLVCYFWKTGDCNATTLITLHCFPASSYYFVLIFPLLSFSPPLSAPFPGPALELPFYSCSVWPKTQQKAPMSQKLKSPQIISGTKVKPNASCATHSHCHSCQTFTDNSWSLTGNGKFREFRKKSKPTIRNPS